MGIVVSLLLITVGAFMRFALTVQANSFDVHTAGMILIFVGLVGAALSIAYWASWGGFDRMGGMRRRTVVVTQPEPVVVAQPHAVVTTTVQEREIR
jgi:hypothetical protein